MTARAVDAEALRIIRAAPAFGQLLLLLATFALVVAAVLVGWHDQCARLARGGATVSEQQQHGCDR